MKPEHWRTAARVGFFVAALGAVYRHFYYGERWAFYVTVTLDALLILHELVGVVLVTYVFPRLAPSDTPRSARAEALRLLGLAATLAFVPATLVAQLSSVGNKRGERPYFPMSPIAYDIVSLVAIITVVAVPVLLWRSLRSLDEAAREERVKATTRIVHTPEALVRWFTEGVKSWWFPPIFLLCWIGFVRFSATVAAVHAGQLHFDVCPPSNPPFGC